MRLSRLLRLCVCALLLIALLGCAGVDGRRRGGGRRRSPGAKRHERRQRQRREQRWTTQQQILDDEAGGEGRQFKPRFVDDLDDTESAAAWMPSYPAPAGSSSTQAHMMLVLQWPESLCASARQGCLPHAPLHPYLTIHGLWPLARHLVNCRADFDADRLAAMEAELNAKWPSFFKRSNRSFWQHEYQKHGSCLYATPEEYFETALRLQRAHTPALLSLLRPGLRAMPLAAFTNAVVAKLGVQPMIMCQRNHLTRRRSLRSADGEIEADDSGYESDDESDLDAPAPDRGTEQLLVEVGLCFSKDGALRDCPEKGRIRRCRRNQPVLLPALGTFTDATPVPAAPVAEPGVTIAPPPLPSIDAAAAAVAAEAAAAA